MAWHGRRIGQKGARKIANNVRGSNNRFAGEDRGEWWDDTIHQGAFNMTKETMDS